MSNYKIYPLVLYSLVLGVASQLTEPAAALLRCGDAAVNGRMREISIDSNMPALSIAMPSLLLLNCII